VEIITKGEFAIAPVFVNTSTYTLYFHGYIISPPSNHELEAVTISLETSDDEKTLPD
jgi:hypothetical protein